MSKILVIDDDIIVCKMIEIMLEKEGHEVEVTLDADFGIKRLKEYDFDLIITDLIMPGKEGIDVIRELKKGYPNVKIMAISGGGMMDSKRYLEIAKAMGADVTLEKPFEKKELVDSVKSLLE